MEASEVQPVCPCNLQLETEPVLSYFLKRKESKYLQQTAM